jgi:hypothetical protein
MKESPTRGDMMNPSNAQRGKPNYVDEAVETPDSTFYPSRGQDAPAYVANNPRYWEYR